MYLICRISNRIRQLINVSIHNLPPFVFFVFFVLNKDRLH